jgi:hypothetical protein
MILDELLLRKPMPISYFLPPFYRTITGGTLITSKHKLLGLSRNMKVLPGWDYSDSEDDSN